MTTRNNTQPLTPRAAAAFFKKFNAFRRTLVKNQRAIIDEIFHPSRPQTATGQQDGNGRIKIDSRHILNKSGSIEECPVGTTVQEGNIGGGKFAYYCG